MSEDDRQPDPAPRAAGGATVHALARALIHAPEVGLNDHAADAMPDDDGPPAPPPPDGPPDGPDDRGEDRGGDPGPGRRRPGRPHGQIFDGCPVKPLGVYGRSSWYLDVRGQLIEVVKHELDIIRYLFGGRTDLLSRKFPQFDTHGCVRPGKFDQADAAAAMCQACDELGVWNPARRLRGPGCWTDDDGALIYHAGDAVLIGGAWQPPGRYGDKTYGAYEPVPRPAEKPGRENPAVELLPFLQTWSWRRDDLDPHLLTGIVCAMMLGAALTWRPVTWLTGDAAAGKSTLQDALRHLLGGEAGLIQSADATKAGITSQIGFSCLPVAIDELEPSDAGSQREKDIITAARIAASGGQFLRGSSDQKGHSGNVYSTFLFSSILIPPLKAQDWSRLIKLDLDPLPKGTVKMVLEPRRLRRVGAQLRRLLVDRWEIWPERLSLWRLALARFGIDGRQADNYGTVLALADLVLHEDAPSEDVLAGWCEKLQGAIATEQVDTTSNAGEMLDFLLSQPLDIWRRGRKYTVAEYLAWAARLPGTGESLGDASDAAQANALLAPYGLRVTGQGAEAVLSIANKPLGPLCELFEGSQWAQGVWRQAAARVPGAQPASRTFARISSRCVDVPFTSLPGMLRFPDRASGSDAARPAPPATGATSADLEDFV